MGIYKQQDNNRISLTKEPIIEIDSGVVYNKSLTKPIHQFEDLLELKGAVPSSYRRFYFSLNAGGLKVDTFNALNLVSLDNLEEALTKLKNEEIDYVISDRYRFRSINREYLINNQLDFKKLDEFTRSSYLAVKTGSPWEQLLPLLDKKLAESKQSGHIDYLEKNYLLLWHKERDCITSRQ